MIWILVLLMGSIYGLSSAVPCIHRDFGYGSTVCVCNSTYCDDVGWPPQLIMGVGQFLHYETNKEGKKLHLTIKDFNLGREPFLSLFDKSIVRFEVNWRKKHQIMLGFGGALTDSAAMNIATLSPNAQDSLLGQYYSLFGIGYSFLRVPMAGSDFSTRWYTYADEVRNDTTLAHFNLSFEDYEYKIPMVQKAVKSSLLPIKLFTTGWSAPFWMTEPRLSHEGYIRLNPKYYQAFADYFVKFLNAYREHGLLFWGITPQNEPTDGLLVYWGFNAIGWTPWEQKDFLGYYLGPTLRENGYEDIQIMILDDQRSLLPFWANIMLADPNVRKYVSGIAIHWYTDWYTYSPPSLISDTHWNFKDKFLLYTEACLIPAKGRPAVPLGSWENAENVTIRMIDVFTVFTKQSGKEYTTRKTIVKAGKKDFVEAFNNMVVGWVDWNLALNPAGGPNWAENFVDAAIIVNSTADEFYKQPMFYTMGHFSRFVSPGSRRIEITSKSPNGILSVAFLRGDNVIVIVMCNRNDDEYNAVITAGLHGNIQVKLPPHSVHTIMYRNGILG